MVTFWGNYEGISQCLVPPGDVNQLIINAGYREPTHKNQYGSQLAFLTVPRALSRIHRITKFTLKGAGIMGKTKRIPAKR